MNAYELQDLLAIAQQAARAAATVHRAYRQKSFQVDNKGSALDLVTTVDREAEQALVDVIRAARPDDGILGEEGSQIQSRSGVTWILDPLDGTVNYVYGYPAHAVAVGIEINGERRIGVVEDTANGRSYSGLIGQGARCDGRALQISQTAELGQALLGTGFWPDELVRRVQGELFGRFMPRVRGIRRSGCPALDLCAVAAGQLDLFYEVGLMPWDIAAGAAIAEAAGAQVLALRSPNLPDPTLIAGNPGLVAQMAALLHDLGAVNR
jgi:myo-inositol-1(or 4)-monophosphatase